MSRTSLQTSLPLSLCFVAGLSLITRACDSCVLPGPVVSVFRPGAAVIGVCPGVRPGAAITAVCPGVRPGGSQQHCLSWWGGTSDSQQAAVLPVCPLCTGRHLCRAWVGRHVCSRTQHLHRGWFPLAPCWPGGMSEPCLHLTVSEKTPSWEGWRLRTQTNLGPLSVGSTSCVSTPCHSCLAKT